MAFWTSNEPGVLPEWIFWLFSTTALLSLISLGTLPSGQISTEHIVGFLVSALTAGLARINAVKVLVGINAVACLFIVAGTLIVVLAVDMESKGVGVVSAIMVGYAAFSVWWVWYLNLYRVKPSPTTKVSRPPTDSYPVAKSYSAPLPKGAGSAPYEKQLAERGILDIEHGEKPEDPSPDDYATELNLFDAGELDQPLWAKHLVEAEGDAEKAKWKYLKERVGTAPVRRAEHEKAKIEAEMQAFAEAQRLEKERLAAERKAAEEAIHRRIEREIEQEEAERKAAEEAERVAAEEPERKCLEEREAKRVAAEEAKRKRLEAWGYLLALFLVTIFLIFISAI